MRKKIFQKTIRVDNLKRFNILLKAIKKYMGEKSIEQGIAEMARFHIPEIVNELYPKRIEVNFVGDKSQLPPVKKRRLASRRGFRDG